jgi:hypothetical protein
MQDPAVGQQHQAIRLSLMQKGAECIELPATHAELLILPP